MDIMNRLKHSRFFITINTQNYYVDKDNKLKRDAKELKELYEEITKDINDIIIIKKEEDTKKDIQKIIRNIEHDYSLELGTNKKGSRLHIHALLQIHHYTLIGIDFDKIRSKFNKHYGKNIHMHSILIRNSDDVENILEYMKKGELSKSKWAK